MTETSNMRFTVTVDSIAAVGIDGIAFVRALVESAKDAGHDIGQPRYAGASPKTGYAEAYYDCSDLGPEAALWLRLKTDASPIS